MFADNIIYQMSGKRNTSFVLSSAFPDICCCLSPTDVTQIHLSPSPSLLFFIILVSLNMIIPKYNTKMFIVSFPFLSYALGGKVRRTTYGIVLCAYPNRALLRKSYHNNRMEWIFHLYDCTQCVF